MRDIRPSRTKKKPRREADIPVTAVHVPERPLFYKTKVKKFKPLWRLDYKERRLLVAGLALLGVLVLLTGFIFLPTATVRLALRTAPLLIDAKMTIKAEPAVQVLTDAGEPVVPGTTFFRELQLSGESPVTSTQVVGRKAAGTVRIVNRTLDEQKIKENSRLVTKPGVLFFMKEAVFVPPNGAATVAVEAAEAGADGNITPQRLTFAALPESTASILYAEAEQTFSGGSGEVVPVVGEADLQRAKEAVIEAGRKQAEEEIKKELPSGWVLLTESWTVETGAFETPAKIDEQRRTIPYTAKVVARVLGYQEEAFKQYLMKALEARLDKDHMLFPGDVSFVASVQSVDWEKHEGVVVARVTHTTIPRFSVEALRDKLAGRSATEAKEYLIGLPGVRSADVTLKPFWVRAIPRIQRRVQIELIPETQP